ncbi:DUF1045 domain-containing protein [Neotabrizicola shimadae]|uniref:DUF1045 domain-containing protein n=1 Tax=Neotabrizicola shimadae TaxID=2807096 RepID=A0A8G1EBM8_9RHOB|nr:DUF1045 domain-containing protein [Neotabrizicola shimadae]QYZ69790.1 DUF1045 domain-containing protein [Neotabrizicola shimadae]
MTIDPRFAVYHLPSDADFFAFSSAWLGWDAVAGTEPPAPDLPPLPLPRAQITDEPRRYGFHATLKAPFRLAPGTTAEALDAALAVLATRLAPVTLTGLALTPVGRFLALTPADPSDALQDLAARCVADLDRFRAPLTPEDIARRRPDRLTPNQRRLLDLWGYPYVMDEFRFHMTLTGPLDPEPAAAVAAILEPHLAALAPRPYRIDALCLVAEGPDNRFRLVSRHLLTASPAT